MPEMTIPDDVEDDFHEDGDKFSDPDLQRQTVVDKLLQETLEPGISWKGTIDQIGSLLQQRHGSGIELQWHEKKGRVLISTKTCSPGEIIFQDRPLALTPTPTSSSNLLWDHLCQVCEERELPLAPLWYWAALNAACTDVQPDQCSPSRPMKQQAMSTNASQTASDDEEAPAEDEIEPLMFLQAPSKIAKQRLSLLYHEKVSEPSFDIMIIMAELNLVGLLDPLEVETMLLIFTQNCLHLPSSEGNSALGVWFTASFLSHSCIPNCAWCHDESGKAMITARRPVFSGDELTISYISEDDLVCGIHHRRELLAKSKRFICECVRCASNDAINPFRCFLCKEILLFDGADSRSHGHSCLQRMVRKLAVRSFIWTHIAICAITSSNY